MAKKARRVPPKERPRQNTPLLFLLLIMVPLFGGYYHFSVFLSGAALVLLLLHGVWRAGALRLPVGPEAWCLYGLCGLTLLTIPFGVSSGMAFAGSLRLAVWVLFFLYAATYTDQERADILNAVAYEGAVLSLITIAGFLYDAAAGIDEDTADQDLPKLVLELAMRSYASGLACHRALAILAQRTGHGDLLKKKK